MKKAIQSFLQAHPLNCQPNCAAGIVTFIFPLSENTLARFVEVSTRPGIELLIRITPFGQAIIPLISLFKG
jgi:hypothetical protein